MIISDEYKNYAENSYPGNHTYKIHQQKLTPKCKLAVRYRKISRHYPKPLTSLLDVACSKGFFVFSAAAQPECTRSLGVDLFEYDLNFCEGVKKYLGNDRVNFAYL